MPLLKQPLTLLTILTAALLFSAWMPTLPVLAQQPNTLEEAITTYAETQGEVYAGDCDGTTLPEDIGQWCSRTESESTNEALVMFGPAFSEFSVRVLFVNVDDVWQATCEERLTLTEGAMPHFILPGQTLGSIAALYGVTVEAIVTYNGIADPAVIWANTTILVPAENGPVCALSGN